MLAIRKCGYLPYWLFDPLKLHSSQLLHSCPTMAVNPGTETNALYSDSKYSQSIQILRPSHPHSIYYFAYGLH